MPDIQPVESEDTGVSAWVVVAVVVTAVALLSVPLWFLIQAALDADPTPAADVSGEQTSEVAPLDDTDATGELLTESAGVDLPEGVVGVVVGTVALDTDLEGTVLMTPGTTLDCGGHTVRGSGTQAGVIMANDATVRNCLISGFNTGVALTATDGALVENVEVTNSRIGFYLVNGTSNATITGSTSVGNEIGFLFEPSVSSVHIEANTAVRNWRSGFMIGFTTNSTFNNNEAIEGGSGFWITNSRSNTFLGNRVSGASEWFSFGLFESTSDNVVENNEVTRGGVAFALGSGAAENSLRANTATNASKGYDLSGGARNNELVENVSIGAHDGFWVGDNAGRGNVLTGNYSEGSTNWGFVDLTTGSSGDFGTDSTYSNNVCVDNGSDATPAQLC